MHDTFACSPLLASQAKLEHVWRPGRRWAPQKFQLPTPIVHGRSEIRYLLPLIRRSRTSQPNTPCPGLSCPRYQKGGFSRCCAQPLKGHKTPRLLTGGALHWYTTGGPSLAGPDWPWGPGSVGHHPTYPGLVLAARKIKPRARWSLVFLWRIFYPSGARSHLSMDIGYYFTSSLLVSWVE